MSSLSEDENDKNIKIDSNVVIKSNDKPQNKKEQVQIPEKKMKPHEKIIPDYTKNLFPSQEETSDQAPLVIVVQGSKNVSFLI